MNNHRPPSLSVLSKSSLKSPMTNHGNMQSGRSVNSRTMSKLHRPTVYAILCLKCMLAPLKKKKKKERVRWFYQSLLLDPIKEGVFFARIRNFLKINK